MEFNNIYDVNIAEVSDSGEYNTWLYSQLSTLSKDKKCFLIFCSTQENVKIFFHSFNEDIRAIEFMDFLIQRYGLIKGDKDAAVATLSSEVVKLLISGSDTWDVKKYIEMRTKEYFEDCSVINAIDYKAAHEEDILKLPMYKKKRIPWAVVRSTDIAPSGTDIFIKSLENESGFEIETDEEVYIMVGHKGEVYDIRRSKFEKSYEYSDEKLDIFESMLEYIPEVMLSDSREYISIDDKANLCYPTRNVGIYVGVLNRRTRVFAKGDRSDYFVGREGDILAIRQDDLTDMYIIQREIFEKTYELCVE